MNIVFVSSFSPIVADPAAARRLFVEGLGLRLDKQLGDYAYTEGLAGTKHFGLWPLTEAAEACFGTPTWPADVRIPQASLEFEVASAAEVVTGAAELTEKGHTLLHAARTEPWGQTVARLLSPDGLIVGLSFAPWMH